MAQDQTLVNAAKCAMTDKHGSAELFGKNNQYGLVLPSGKRTVIKTGSKGQVMQRTHGAEIKARFTGVEDADCVVIAVKWGPAEVIRVFEIPGKVYRDRMTLAYAELLQSEKLQPTDLRVLRFDGKGYPEQRVSDEWAKYQLNVSRDARPVSFGNRDLNQAIESAKAMVANALGVPLEKVSISVTM